MSQDSIREDAYRRRRIYRLRRMAIQLLPIVLCVILFFRVSELSKAVEQLTGRLEEMEALAAASRGQVNLQAVGQGQANQEADDQGQAGQEADSQGQAGQEAAGQEPAGQQEEISEQEADASAQTAYSEESVSSDDAEQEAAHKVYLTFDDGPSSNTEEILDILDRYDVKATFFVVGKESDSAKEILRDIVNRGHTLGMHSYSHDYAEVYASVEAFAEDFEKLQTYLEEVTGVESVVYRFPGGSSNTVSEVDMWEYADYLEDKGVRFFDWNISSGDGGSVLLPVETLVENATKDIAKYKTSVILLHDSQEKSTTVEALPLIIENILAMENTVILPITEETRPVQHIQRQADDTASQTKRETEE